MVQELVNSGDLTTQQARRHPQKNIITRALGVESGIEIDYCECKFSGDDLLLLCTDGLTNYVEEEQIERLARTGSPASAGSTDRFGKERRRRGQCHGRCYQTLTVLEMMFHG